MYYEKHFCKKCNSKETFEGTKHFKLLDFILLFAFFPLEILYWVFKTPDFYCSRCRTKWDNDYTYDDFNYNPDIDNERILKDAERDEELFK